MLNPDLLQCLQCFDLCYLTFQLTELGLILGYVETCIADDTGIRFPFLCTAPDLVDRIFKAAEAAPGTKCVSANGNLGDNVSFSTRISKSVLFIFAILKHDYGTAVLLSSPKSSFYNQRRI